MVAMAITFNMVAVRRMAMKSTIRTLLAGAVFGFVLALVLQTQAQNFTSVQVGPGSSFAPSYTFLADNKKGLYDNGTNSIGAAVNSTVGMQLTQSTAQAVEL